MLFRLSVACYYLHGHKQLASGDSLMLESQAIAYSALRVIWHYWFADLKQCVYFSPLASLLEAYSFHSSIRFSLNRMVFARFSYSYSKKKKRKLLIIDDLILDHSAGCNMKLQGSFIDRKDRRVQSISAGLHYPDNPWWQNQRENRMWCLNYATMGGNGEINHLYMHASS